MRVRAGAPPAERWLVAVALGGQGRYAAAAATLRGLLADPQVPPTMRAHAAVTLAAHRRQLGGHAAARPLDAYGLRLAASALGSGQGADQDADLDPLLGVDAHAARIDALIGLAADALGAGDPAGTRRLLAAGQAAAERHPSWRPLVRIGWVRAESALSGGRPADAVACAQAALDLAERGGSVRHVLKSRIVLAVAESVAASDAGGDPAALGELDAAGDEAERLGLLPLVWPARMAAADALERASAGCLGELSTAIEQAPGATRKSMTIRSGDVAGLRHAGVTTLSVIERRCDPDGRLLMGEWWADSARRRVT